MAGTDSSDEPIYRADDDCVNTRNMMIAPPPPSRQPSGSGSPCPVSPMPGLMACSGFPHAIFVSHASSREVGTQEGVLDELVDCLADEWARIKLGNTELRSSCTSFAQNSLTISNMNKLMAQMVVDLDGAGGAPSPPIETLNIVRCGPRSYRGSGTVAATSMPSLPMLAHAAAPPPLLPPLALPLAMGSPGILPPRVESSVSSSTPVIVIAAGEDTDEKEDADDKEDEEDRPFNPFDPISGAAASADTGREDRPFNPISGAAASADTGRSSPRMSPMALAPGMAPDSQQSRCDLGGSKRSRSFLSEFIVQPLQPAKQRSAPSSRSSPTAEQQRVQQLRELIAAEKAEREALLVQFRENQRTLARLQEVNASLLAEVARLKAQRGALEEPSSSVA